MSEDCQKTDCAGCGVTGCGSRKGPEVLTQPNELSDVKHLIVVISGKGGVGKSMVTSLLSNAMRSAGKSTAIMDADITGPSIPRIYGIREQAGSDGERVIPVMSEKGIRMMSINLLLDHETDPVVWRGAMIASTVRQFWTEVLWGDVDYMFVDMPPGTGDVPLTVFQSLPVEGIVVVASPQDLVSMIVAKAVRMAELMNKPILGIVENMSGFKCPDCGKVHDIFGKSSIGEISKAYGIDTVVRLPIDPAMAALCDAGRGDELETDEIKPIVDVLLALPERE